MNDILGAELALGNLVIMKRPDYAGLCIGKIIAFTPQKVRIEYKNTWNYSSSGLIANILTWPEDVCKIDGPDATAYILKHSI